MIPAFLYQYIYLTIVAIMTFVVLAKYRLYKADRLLTEERHNYIWVFLLALSLALFIGFRPVDELHFVDMFNYDRTWYEYADSSYKWTWDTDNIIFDNLFGFLSGYGFSSRFLFVSLATIYFGGILWACIEIFPKDAFISFLVYLAAFSTFAYSTNGLKAGSAASLFLVAVASFSNKGYLRCLLFLVLSLGFHHSMVLPITCFFICIFYRNPKIYFLIWILCVIIAALHITFFQTLFAGFVDEQGASYLLGGGHVKTQVLGGFRIDFIVYSSVPIVFGLIAIIKKKINSSFYNFLLSLYTLTNAIWLLCMYAEFTNRISYLSWLLYPFVLIYPFLKEYWGERQYGTFRTVTLGHLFFTLFMVFVYYG